jgi:hypothetical protein
LELKPGALSGAADNLKTTLNFTVPVSVLDKKVVLEKPYRHLIQMEYLKTL